MKRLGLALFGRFLFIPKWTSQIQPTIDKIDAVVQAQPSTRDVEVGTPPLDYSDVSIGTLPRLILMFQSVLKPRRMISPCHQR